MDAILSTIADGGSDWQRLRTVVWRRLDVPSMELCQLAESERGFLLEGQVLTAVEHVPRNVRYRVLCDRSWNTVGASVAIETNGDVARLTLRREPDGRWFRDDVELVEMRGLCDVDLGFTPATNTLPIRRLAPDIGEASDVIAVWVRFPDLVIEQLPQTYVRAGELAYQYESRGGRFRALIGVDDVGLVTAYERLFERLASS